MAEFSEFLARPFLSEPAPLFPRSPRDVRLSEELAIAVLFPAEDGEMVEACRAGLLLFNDDLDAAHRLVQDLESPTGAFWHAIVHRREGDFGNSNYWWNRTGEHPAFERVYLALQPLLGDSLFADEPILAAAIERTKSWRPNPFVEACERAWRAENEPEALKNVQMIEMKALLDWCREQV